MKTFYSKKNNVVSTSGIIRKQFRSVSAFENELFIYSKLTLKGLCHIPKIIKTEPDNKTIYMTYLSGVTILERLEGLEVEENKKAAVQTLILTLEWLEAFYSSFEGHVQIMGDVNLRNFIWYEEKVYGIDFETAKTGNKDVEKLELLARYMLYDPSESRFKKEVLEELIREYYQDHNRIKVHIEDIMKTIVSRRKSYK